MPVPAVASLAAVDPAAVVLAHQGGWDEIALVAGPLAVFAGLLWLAKRRATALAERVEVAERADAAAERDDDRP